MPEDITVASIPEVASPEIKSVPSFLNNDGIDQLTPLQTNTRSSNLSLSDQWAGLNSAKSSFGNLNGLHTPPTTAGPRSRSSSFASRRPSIIAKRQSKQTKIDHPRIANYSFAFDIDGVIVKGPETIPQAREALKLLNGANEYNIKVPYIFVTNGGGRSEKARSEELSKRLDITVEENQVIQGHTPMKDLVSKFKTVLVVGGVGDACRKVAEGYGFENVVIPLDIMRWKPSVSPYHTLTPEEIAVTRADIDFSKVPIDGILVFADSRSWAADQQIILELLLSKNGIMGTFSPTFDEGPGIYFAHSDFLWSTNYGLSRYGMGALQVSIAAIYGEHTGKELTVTRFGKPQRGTFKYADKVLNAWRKNKLEEYVKEVSSEDEDEIIDQTKKLEAEERESKVASLRPPIKTRPTLKSRLSNSKFQVLSNDDSSSEDSSDEDVEVEFNDDDRVIDGDMVLDLPPSSTVYFVGDTPESDIRFANSHDASWYSILVKTGVYQEGTQPKYMPKHTCDNVLEAVKFAIEREHQKEVDEWNKNAESLASVVGLSRAGSNGSGALKKSALDPSKFPPHELKLKQSIKTENENLCTGVASLKLN